MGVDQRKALLLCLFHNLHTPVEICREAVTGVVQGDELAVGIESLMADHHAATETATMKPLRRRKASLADKATVVIYNVGIAIDHTGFHTFGDALHQSLEGIGSMQFVARIQETHIIARGHADGSVHRIVKPLVALAHHDDICLRITTLVGLGQSHCAVLRPSVLDDVLHTPVGLLLHTAQGTLQSVDCVEGDCNQGYHSYIALYCSATLSSE